MVCCFKDPATTESYTHYLQVALPIYHLTKVISTEITIPIHQTIPQSVSIHPHIPHGDIKRPTEIPDQVRSLTSTTMLTTPTLPSTSRNSMLKYCFLHNLSSHSWESQKAISKQLQKRQDVRDVAAKLEAKQMIRDSQVSKLVPVAFGSMTTCDSPCANSLFSKALTLQINC